MTLMVFVMELSKFHNFLTRPCGRGTRAAAFKLFREAKLISLLTAGSLSSPRYPIRNCLLKVEVLGVALMVLELLVLLPCV